MTTSASLFGLTSTNHDLSKPTAWGKNIFTNTVPVSLAQFCAMELRLPVVELTATTNVTGQPRVVQELREWGQIIGCTPAEACFAFEIPFDGFRPYAVRDPEKSDVVVHTTNGTHTRALEIKLTVVPDNQTHKRDHDSQGPEIVTRPPTIEQLGYTLCESFGPKGREHIASIIQSHIATPQQFKWQDHDYVKQRINLIEKVIADIILSPHAKQVPLVLNVIWRTLGTKPVLEENCFEVFVWSNLAFLTAFFDSSRSSRSDRLTRQQRSLVWIVKLMHDYSVQGVMDRRDTFEAITFGRQTDKAGAFGGAVTAPYLSGTYLSQPRIPASALSEIIGGQGAMFLAPERRLDATAYIQLVRDSAITENP